MNEQKFCPGGAAHIQKMIDEAVQNGTRTATVTGCWEIDEAVRIPGDFTLVLDGCGLRMADGCFANLFVNEHHGTPEGKTTAGTDRNIAIIGKNRPVLDGGTHNGLSEQTQLKNGLPPVWKNNLILFTNVDGFEISGLHCRNQRWWALNFVYCANGVVRDMDFAACDLAVDRNGNVYRGLSLRRYKEIMVKNADGVDIRQGCHDITIENITGFTEDDSVAITGLNWLLEKEFAVEGLSPDIRNITVKNVATAALCTNVRTLNQGGIKLYNILIDGVYDCSADSPSMDRGLYAVRIGDVGLYGSRHATPEETHHITIRNVRSRGSKAAVGLAGGMKDIVVEQIECFDGAVELEDARS